MSSTFFGLIAIFFEYTDLPMFALESSYKPEAMVVLSSVTFVFCLGVLVLNIYKIIKAKRNQIISDNWDRLDNRKTSFNYPELDFQTHLIYH